MHLSGKLPLKQGIPMKVVVDDHFDRSGVKALRDVELTDTNNLIDLNHLKMIIHFYTLCVYAILSIIPLFMTLHFYSLTMNRWLLLLGTTRSLPELGRETNTRQWYFGLSRGRVGHCRFFLNEYSVTPRLLSSLPVLLSCCTGCFLIVGFLRHS